MKRKKSIFKKSIITLACLLMILTPCVTSVLAVDTIPTATIEPIKTESPTTTTENGNSTFNNANNTIIKSDSEKTYDSFGLETNLLPDVTIEDTASQLNKKAAEAINYFRQIMYWVLIAAFIIVAFKMVFGFLGSKFTIMQGFIGFLIIGLAYLVLRYAPEILAAWDVWIRK